MYHIEYRRPKRDQEKILILQPNHIGDLLLATPFLHRIRKGFPDAFISILVGSWSAGILKNNSDPDEIILCNFPWLQSRKIPHWPNLFLTLKHIRKRKFDHVLTLPVSAKTAGFAVLCGAHTRWGFDAPKSQWAWTQVLPSHWELHVVDTYMDMAKHFGAPSLPIKFRIFPQTKDYNSIDYLLEDGLPPVLLGVTTRNPNKSWRPDRWAAVADFIIDRGFKVLINGGPSEEDQVEAVRDLMQYNATSLAGRLSFHQFAALLSKCTCLITLDSFPMHLGVAVDTSVICLFGPTNPQRWGPYPNGQPNQIIKPPTETPRKSKAMQQIQTDQVTEAFDRLLQKLNTKENFSDLNDSLNGK